MSSLDFVPIFAYNIYMSRRNIVIDKKLLEQYCDKEKSIRQISVLMNCSPGTIKRRLHTYNLKTTRMAGRLKTILCEVCGNHVKKRYKTARFCSIICHRTYVRNSRIQSWLSGKWDGSTNSKTDRLSAYIRKYLKEQADYKCVQCGWNKINPTTNKVPLTVHHIDGNWKNNRSNNLKILCPNCHSLTTTFGSLNTGNGRQLNPK